MKGYVARAMRVGLSKVGEPSFLDGVECGNVNVQRGVAVETGIGSLSEDNYVSARDIATISNEHAPHVGQVLTHPDGEFRLDKLIADNGATTQFILVPA